MGISREPQPAAVDELTALSVALGAGADGKACLIDAQIHQLVAAMLAVATHADSTLANGKSGVKEAKAEKKQAPLLVDTTALEMAITSALTKFDAVEATFAELGQRGIPALVNRLTAEVLSDADLELPVVEDARKVATRQVNQAIAKRVGTAFGGWKKKRAAA